MDNLLIPPKNGVTVRMYRQGHGDCFLIAFNGTDDDKPYHVLIDCGLKPGSQNFIHKDPQTGEFIKGPTTDEIVAHIGQSTGNHLDLFIITHEHQDHLNGIWKKNNPFFQNFEIEEAWFAWTEDPTDELANTLRKRHRDQLLGLVAARNQLALAAGPDSPTVQRLDELLSMEIGGQEEDFVPGLMGVDGDLSNSVNKQAMKLIKDKASTKKGVRYLKPGDQEKIPTGDKAINVYVFGPPKSDTLLADEDPRDNESFPNSISGQQNVSFMAAASGETENVPAPFDSMFHFAFEDKIIYFKDGVKYDRDKSKYAREGIVEEFFLKAHYGEKENKKEDNDSDKKEVSENASWRRIDEDWLFSAENLALKLNTGINNTSLVLAFELPQTKKVLFFVGDAQRGNWISWNDQSWGTAEQKITVQDILSRAVLYKVGHHGSHNATLSGQLADKYANLAWMGQGKFAGEFTAMITAVNIWAKKNTPPWEHPLPSIKKALELKTGGRVFQTDVSLPKKPDDVSVSAWDAFLSRSTFDKLYFDYTILDV